VSGIRSVEGLRVAMGTLLQSTAVVMRKTRVADASGGQTDTYTKVATLPCRYIPGALIPREREERGILIQSDMYWQFTFAWDADVRPTDRLVAAGRTFEVQGGGPPSLGIFNTITCLEIR
jgi:hypothetical protein